MKKIDFVLFILTFLSSIAAVVAQDKFYTKNGNASFYSEAPIENIQAHNKSATCVLDSKTGEIQFSLLMKGFEFRKALMQEHFNEDYMDSDKFPRSEFKGQIVNNKDVNYSKNGDYTVKVKGNLVIHGVTKEIETDGKVTVSDNKILIGSEFSIELPDYDVKNDRFNNISNHIKIVVNCSLELLKK